MFDLDRLGLGSRAHRPTLSDYLSDWIGLCRTRGLRPATVASYEATLRLHVSRELLATRIDHVTPQALNAHYAFLLASGRKVRLGVAEQVQWDKKPAEAGYVTLADPKGTWFCVIDTTR